MALAKARKTRGVARLATPVVHLGQIRAPAPMFLMAGGAGDDAARSMLTSQTERIGQEHVDRIRLGFGFLDDALVDHGKGLGGKAVRRAAVFTENMA